MTDSPSRIELLIMHAASGRRVAELDDDLVDTIREQEH